MSFASRKLYPTSKDLTKPPCNSCCCTDCPCYVQGLIAEGSNVQSDEYCFCPNITLPDDTCEDETCLLCTISFPPCNGPWWTCSQDGILVCGEEEIPCVCFNSNDTVPPIIREYKCVEPPVNPCCPELVCQDIPIDYGIQGGRVPLLVDCEIGGIGSSGAHPYTYKLESPGVTNFTCGIQNSSNYLQFLLKNPSGTTGYIGDLDFARNPNYIRYYRVPSETNPISNTRRIDFSRYCMKLHETASQDLGSGNRVMIVSGRNVYRYTGVLSGDPALPKADPFWDDPGGSGLSQVEGSLGRVFPLPDSVLLLPLWGETGGAGTDNLGAVLGTDTECVDPYITCEDRCVTSSANVNQCEVCVGWKEDIGCACVLHKPYAATGHYLPNNQGYTAGYFSFACFNPFSYLDAINPTTNNVIPAGGDAVSDPNPIGFGAVVNMPGGAGSTPTNLAFGCTCSAADEAINCSGFAGATAHGPRLGVPTCSVYALVIALYNRIFKTYRTMSTLIGLPLYSNRLMTEQEFREGGSDYNEWFGFPNFSAAVDACLAANPSGTTNNVSNVQYHLAKISEALLLDSTQNASDGFGGPIRFTFPNVFLWDRTNFISASATNKWKHLYVIGNANVVFDSFSSAITGPCYESPTDPQDYRSFVFTLDEVTHRKDSTVTDRTHQARLMVFNGSEGPTFGGGPNDANPASRKNASSRISLTELPVCFGLTTAASQTHRPSDPVLSLCEICNAWPAPVCLSGASCVPVSELPANVRNKCYYPGGLFFSPNCMTASYQVPGADNSGDGNNFLYSTITQPYSIYIDPELMVAFSPDPLRLGNVQDPDDPTGTLGDPYRNRLAAVSNSYTYMQEDTRGYVGFTGFKEFFDDLTAGQRKNIMIEQERPWTEILREYNNFNVVQSSWINNPEVIDEFTRQRNLGYISGGLTPGSASLSDFKGVAKRLFGDCAAYARANGAENIINFSESGLGYAHSGLSYEPMAGTRSIPTTDGRSWWRADSSFLTIEQRYAQSMPGGSKDNFADFMESTVSGDANVMQLYNFFANTGSTSIDGKWRFWGERLVPSEGGAGGSAGAGSTGVGLSDLNYWSKMTYGAHMYEFRKRLDELDALTTPRTYNVNPNRSLATIIAYSSPPIFMNGTLDGGWVLSNKFTYMKEPDRFADIDIGGLFVTADANVTNVSYPDQVWIWDSANYYGSTIPMYQGTGSSLPNPDAAEFEILTARSQYEKLFFKRAEIQLVSEGGLSSEAELISSDPWNTGDTGLRDRRKSWLRANTLPNVYWDARAKDGSNNWYSEGVTNNIRYWSATTGNCLPAPCVLDRTSSLAPWLNFSNDIYKNDVRIAIKHWISERYTTAVESSYKYLSRLNIPPIIPADSDGGNEAI